MQTGKRNAKRLPGIKRMTVELESPFVYPAEPEDLSPYVESLCRVVLEEAILRRGEAGFRMDTDWMVLTTDGIMSSTKISTSTERRNRRTGVRRLSSLDGKRWRSWRRAS